MSRLVRDRSFFFRLQKVKQKEYLDVGCGHSKDDNFINLDYDWYTHVDLCIDIRPGNYPIPDEHLKGIYSEHCLEHIPYEAMERNLKAFYRMLKPGGRIRISMPDGEKFLDIYRERKKGASTPMPILEECSISPMASINFLFRSWGHQFIYDFETLEKLLVREGFKEIKRCTFRQGSDPILLRDIEWREPESFYVEAVK
jgi:predicted SAM-dependent methyltransferase